MTTDRATSRRRLLAALAGLGGALAIVASFLPWIHTDTEDGGNTAITGWGGITGSSSIAGTNLNEVLDGSGTYRPGLFGVIFGVIAVIAAIAVASVSNGPRPHRVTASVLMLCGLVLAGWGLYRAIDAGDAGFDELIAQAGDGLYVTDVVGLHSGVNPISGTFSVGATGRLIENGELAAPVREITIASDLVSMLKGITAIGADPRWVPFGGSVRAVPLLLGEMAVSGS